MSEKFIKAALIRAIRTFAQVLLGYISVGMALQDIDWKTAASVSVTAMIYSVLTSCVTKLPEVDK